MFIAVANRNNRSFSFSPIFKTFKVWKEWESIFIKIIFHVRLICIVRTTGGARFIERGFPIFQVLVKKRMSSRFWLELVYRSCGGPVGFREAKFLAL